MEPIIATFVDGVLKPEKPLDLPDHSVVRLTVERLATSAVVVQNLSRFLEGLPSLGDDAGKFAEAVRTIRAEFPAEVNRWE